MRLTIQFTDGRSVTNIDPSPRDPEVPAFEQPMMSSGPGTGGGVDGWSFDMEYRVRPLPPPGSLAFICVWPTDAIQQSKRPIRGRDGTEFGDRRLASLSQSGKHVRELSTGWSAGPVGKVACDAHDHVAIGRSGGESPTR